LAYDRNSNGVSDIAAQHRAHRVFEKFGIKSIGVIDYLMARRKNVWGPLRDIYQDGRCDIGAHFLPG